MSKERCAICGRGGKLVRDHSHRSGMIRGLLCDPCNGRLGAFESDQRTGRMRGGRKYQRWVSRFAAEIAEHLMSNTGVRYERPKRREVLSRIDREPVEIMPMSEFEKSHPAWCFGWPEEER